MTSDVHIVISTTVGMEKVTIGAIFLLVLPQALLSISKKTVGNLLRMDSAETAISTRS